MSKHALLILSVIAVTLVVCLSLLVPWLSGSGSGVSVSARPSRLELPDTRIESDSRWYGTLTLDSVEGSGPLQDGETEVWGMLDATDGGALRFRLYTQQRPKKADKPLFSFLCSAGDDGLTPLPDPDGAWILEKSFSEGSPADLALRLESGRLSASASYRDGQQSAELRLILFPL